ncbi:MAG: CopG family transcriptional regulator [Deltaproteobacteria bacterium]|nr:CopG family transcriptional regulator [Deltaproteobacteria bacterium]
MADKGDVTIKIPRPLYEKLQAIIADTGFHSVTEFIVYVLRDLVSTEATAAAKQGGTNKHPPEDFDAGLTAEEIRIIRKRLQDLGYL